MQQTLEKAIEVMARDDIYALFPVGAYCPCFQPRKNCFSSTHKPLAFYAQAVNASCEYYQTLIISVKEEEVATTNRFVDLTCVHREKTEHDHSSG